MKLKKLNKHSTSDLREAARLCSRKEHEFTRGSLTNAQSEGHTVDEILLDLSKAFDLVPHRRLIHKIRGYGAPNELTVWLEDFFKNRR